MPLRRKLASTMGAFYGSIHIRTENSDVVQKALNDVAKGADCRFLLGPALNGWISVFPNDGGQNDRISVEISKLLPNDIFHLIVHDDDIFGYYFYRNGRLIDQYNSCPDYFEEASNEEKQQCQGRPELFQDLLPKPESLGKLKALLVADEKNEFIFEHERMAQFAELLGLSNALSSYEYLQAGERDEIKGWKQFVHIPDLSAEKAAKRAAKARIAAEKKRLQKEGILLAEIKPPSQKGAGLPISIAWGTDSASNGLVLAWQSFHFTKPVDDEQTATEFFTIQPPWNVPLQPVGLKTNWTAHVFCMSPSANWLAGGFVAGDWNMRVWDWRRKELAFEVPHTRAVDSVTFSRDERWVYSLGGEEFIVASLEEKRPVITINGVGGARGAAVHPSGKFVAVGLQNQLGIIDLEKKLLVKRLWVGRGIKIMDRWPNISDKQVAEKFLQNPEKLKKLGIESQQQIESWVGENRFIKFESQEHLFDMRFSPDGEQIFIATGSGMGVFDWNKLVSADKDAPPPVFFVDAPKDDEDDPNSRPLTYCVRFDPERNLLLSSCLAGVIQYLNINNGRSGTLFKLPDEVSVWRFELTADGKALCCHCGSRPKVRNQNKRVTYLQVWNYPALCKAAGLG